jgi:hypothetical protein
MYGADPQKKTNKNGPAETGGFLVEEMLPKQNR